MFIASLLHLQVAVLDERAAAAVNQYAVNGTGNGANPAVDFMQDRVREHCMSVQSLAQRKGPLLCFTHVIDVR